MKRIFLDANILLDVALRRMPFAVDSSRIFSLEKNYLKFTSSLNISNVYFLIRKDYDKYVARTNIGIIIQHCQMLDVNSMMIKNAHVNLFERFNDFEDAVQHYCAVAHSMDVIVTRNGKDFRNAEIPVYSPKDFIKAFGE
ncbi:MAG: PIN domain-containing protein [Chitinophagales bacterium]|nr:PIN domain-containing protein [Chitinophagales bacterium]